MQQHIAHVKADLAEWLLNVNCTTDWGRFSLPHIGWCIGPAGGGKSSDDTRVQGRLDGVVNALLLVSLPLWFYVAVHFQSLLKWEHFWSVLILGAAPWCLLSMLEGDRDRSQPSAPGHVELAEATPLIPHGQAGGSDFRWTGLPE